MAKVVSLSPLKFYDSLQKQNHRKPSTFGQMFPLLMPLKELYPFQFVVPRGTTSIVHIELYDASSDKFLNDVELPGLKVLNGPLFNIVIYPGQFPLSSASIAREGTYFIKLTDNNGISYFSELFCMTCDTDDCLLIEYTNPSSDFHLKNGAITFKDNFKFKVLLRTELAKPKYTFDEDATTRLGYNFIESQVSKKTYSFTALAPEYLCDALRIIRLCSEKRLTCMGEEYDMLSFSIDVHWEEMHVASVQCEFEVDNIITNIGGPKFDAPDQPNDFNIDYDQDFN